MTSAIGRKREQKQARTGFAAALLALSAAAADAMSAPPALADPRIGLAVEHTASEVTAEGELVLGLAVWTDSAAPLRVEAAEASIGSGVAFMGRTDFMGYDLMYPLERWEIAPERWSRLAGADGAVVITGVSAEALSRGPFQLHLDFGDAGVHGVSVWPQP